MVFGYPIAAENLMRQRRVIVVERWKRFLSPSAAALEPLISRGKSERCSVRKGDSSPVACLRSGRRLRHLRALVGRALAQGFGAWVGFPCGQRTRTTGWRRKQTRVHNLYVPGTQHIKVLLGSFLSRDEQALVQRQACYNLLLPCSHLGPHGPLACLLLLPQITWLPFGIWGPPHPYCTKLFWMKKEQLRDWGCQRSPFQGGAWIPNRFKSSCVSS